VVVGLLTKRVAQVAQEEEALVLPGLQTERLGAQIPGVGVVEVTGQQVEQAVLES
jgi:hypothetical protein